MAKPIVAVICGGYTAEQNISLLSGDVVFRNINREHYDAFKIIISHDGWLVDGENANVQLEDFSFLRNGEKIKFDCVFNAIHGSPGEDGKIQGYFDMLGIPYTNCGVAASALTFNKYWTKYVVQSEVAVARGILIRRNNTMQQQLTEIKATFSLPVFVKPNNNGSSYGISMIKDFTNLEAAVDEALRFDDEVLVEEGVKGTEVTCGVYRFNDEVIAHVMFIIVL